MHNRKHLRQSRLWIILAGIFILLGIIGWRLVVIALLRHDWYAETAATQAVGGSNVLLRGNIFMSSGAGQHDFLVATNRRFAMAIVNLSRTTPDHIPALADALAVAIGGSRDAIATTLTSDGAPSRVIARRLTDDQVNAVKQLNDPAVSIGYETGRSYPAGMLGANVVGFYGYSDQGRQGQYGIEASYDVELSGQQQQTASTSDDLLGHLGTLLGRGTSQAATHPENIELSIDKNIQAYVENALEGVLHKYSAASGTVVVQEPSTGRIMAMASSPSFDPNSYGSYPISSFLNEAVLPFEPGSSFKPMTMAMGLDLGKITPNSTFNDVGDVVVDGYTIKNFNEGHFGLVTMAKVLEKSINTGVMYVQSLLTHDQFLRYVVDLGFGQKTGIDLPGESAGTIGNLYSNRPINFMTASFGQGITVTPIQLITAYSAIANGGKLMKPMIVDAITDNEGHRVATTPTVVGTPFTAKTAATLRAMLVSVVDNGFDKARIPHYDVAGKTGTAQIASPMGGYLDGQYNHSFVGFVPASDPKFVILIRMEKPKGITFAADSLSPVFKDIALFLLNYLNVPPTR